MFNTFLHRFPWKLPVKEKFVRLVKPEERLLGFYIED